MRMKEFRSLRELTRVLDSDERIRRLCLIEDDERGYLRSVLSRFTRLVGAERLRRIIDEKGGMLLRRSDVREVDMILRRISGIQHQLKMLQQVVFIILLSGLVLK